jgi:Tol biopolymer transport system component/DNA-binding winged helix-turn-helix (wHTH) protein
MKDALGMSKASQTPPADGIIRFGGFEVDLRAGELRRGGLKVKLAGQPFDVLVTLLEKPGRVVTREELHDKLWAQDTFVDFEHGLNKAINKVREALGDTADNPRFIETLPRRGYRFLAPVIQPETPDIEIADQLAPAANQVVVASPAPNATLKRPWIWLAVLVGIVVVVFLVIESLAPRPPRVLHYTQLTNDGLRKAGSLATDGSRIYFPEQDRQQNVFIAQVSVNGGTTTTVARLRPEVAAFFMQTANLDYSPARSELLIDAVQSPLWALNIPGDPTPRRLSDVLADGAAWSPDGQSLAYGRLNELYVAKADGSDSRKIATVQGHPVYLRWSPEGKVVRFTLDAWENSRISQWEIDAGGSNLHPLFFNWQSRTDGFGSWTPNGNYFVYNSFLANGDAMILARREKNGLFQTRVHDPVELTSGPISFFAPLPSNDGKTIFAVGTLDQGQLMRYDGKTHGWVPYLGGISAADADFSRDGEWVTYVLIPQGTLWRSRVDGSERAQLTAAPLRASMPRWSPDGKHIAFAGLKPGGRWSIYMISAEGGDAELLAAPEKKYYQDPNWSPDGKRLVFSESDEAPMAIHILDLQSRQVSDLPGSKGLFSSRWSPDGRFILANTSDIGPNPQKLMLFDVNRQSWQECCQITASYANFSRDGKYLYFSDGAATYFYRVLLGGHKIEVVAKVDVPGGAKKDDFWYWSGLAPDDSPLVMRDASTQEIYALDVDFP